jgi:hypothetical protein
MQLFSFDNQNPIIINQAGIDLEQKTISFDATMYLHIPLIILNQTVHIEDVIIQIDGDVMLSFKSNQILVDIHQIHNIRVLHMNADTQYKQLLVELINNLLQQLFQSFQYQINVDTSFDLENVFNQLCSFVDCKC